MEAVRVIQKLPAAASHPATPPALGEVAYEQLAATDELVAIAAELSSSERPVFAILFQDDQVLALGSQPDRELVAIAQQLRKSREAVHHSDGVFAASIGIADRSSFHAKAALVTRLPMRGGVPNPVAKTIETCARALSAELKARFQLFTAGERAGSDRAYLVQGFQSGLKELRRVADELRAHCLNLPVGDGTGEQQVIRAAVHLAERLRSLEGWVRFAEATPATTADTGRALKVALTRLRSQYALGEDQLRVEQPLPAVLCDEGRLATLLEEALNVLLRRETVIVISAVPEGDEVALQLRCVEMLPSEPPEVVETIPFASPASLRNSDMSLALVAQIARSAAGRLTLGPGYALRVVLPAAAVAKTAPVT